MAAPYIAGCTALLRQIYPELGATTIARRLTSTATPLLFNRTSDILAPTWQQGSGKVNMTAAVLTHTDISVSNLPFNDTEFFTGNTDFIITNSGTEAITYALEFEPAITISSFPISGQGEVVPWTRERQDPSVSEEFLATLLSPRVNAPLHISPSNFLLLPGVSQRVTITAKIDAVLAVQGGCPLYSGFIFVSNNHSETLTVPYGGVGCRMRDIAPLPPTWNQTYS